MAAESLSRSVQIGARRKLGMPTNGRLIRSLDFFAGPVIWLPPYLIEIACPHGGANEIQDNEIQDDVSGRDAADLVCRLLLEKKKEVENEHAALAEQSRSGRELPVRFGVHSWPQPPPRSVDCSTASDPLLPFSVLSWLRQIG